MVLERTLATGVVRLADAPSPAGEAEIPTLPNAAG